MANITIDLTRVFPGNECFTYDGDEWMWARHKNGALIVGMAVDGLWGLFTNGTDVCKVPKSKLAFAIGKQGADMVFCRSIYPPSCFAYLEASDQIVVITRGEPGFRPADICPNGMPKRETVDLLNGALDISKVHASAMYGGALFGWDSEAAKVSSYDKNGKPRRSVIPPKKN